jgi:hypothetical protein
MWIESHDDLWHHPKTRRLARNLGVPEPYAVGLLHYLWWWCHRYASTGDLSAYTAEDLADGLEWEGDPDTLLTALVTAGFLDQTATGYAVHDWYEYAGRLVEQKEARRAQTRERVARYRSQQTTQRPAQSSGSGTEPDHDDPRQDPEPTDPGSVSTDAGSHDTRETEASSNAPVMPCNDDVTRYTRVTDPLRNDDVTLCNAPNITIHNPTEPNPTEPNPTEPHPPSIPPSRPPDPPGEPATSPEIADRGGDPRPDSAGEGTDGKPGGAARYPPAFEEAWLAYPRKVEKRAAYRAWQARRREGCDPADLAASARHYAAAVAGRDPRYVKHAATFWGRDRPYEEYVRGTGPPQARAEPAGWAGIRAWLAATEPEGRNNA